MKNHRFPSCPTPGDALLKHLRTTDKVNTILSEVYSNSQKRNPQRQESKDSFLVQHRRLLRTDSTIRNDIFRDWTISRIQSYLDMGKAFHTEQLDTFDILLFHLIGIAYNAPIQSYPQDSICITSFSENSQFHLIDNFKLGASILISGVSALKEIQLIAEQRKVSFYKNLQHITTRHKNFASLRNIIESKQEIMDLIGSMPHEAAWLHKLQKNLVHTANAHNILLPDSFHSNDFDTLLEISELEGDIYINILLQSLQHAVIDVETTETLRNLLAALSPPLRPRDKNAISSELDDIDEGKLDIKKSLFKNIILPVIRREKKLAPEDETLLGEEFSANFIRDLNQESIALPDASNTSVSTENIDSTGHDTEDNNNQPYRDAKQETVQNPIRPKQQIPSPPHQNALTAAAGATANLCATSQDTPGSAQAPCEHDAATHANHTANANEHDTPPHPSHAHAHNHNEQHKDGCDSHSPQLEQAIKTLLSTKRTCELYWLIKQAPQPELPTWLAELLYLGTRLQPGFRASQNRIKELIDQGEAHCAQAEPLSENTSMLLAASMIRPALMMPAITHKSLMDKIAPTLSRYRCEPLLTSLGDFAVKGVALDDTVFKGLSLMSQRQKHLDELERKIRALLDTTSNKKTSFQRATAVVKELFSPRGELGKALHACLTGDFSPIYPCLEKNWDNKAFLAKAVNELDELINKPPRSSRKIDYKAFDAIMRDVMSAKNLLSDWIDLHEQDTTKSSAVFSHKQLSNIVGKVHPESLPTTPYASFLKTQLEELCSKFNTSTARNSAVDPLHELAVWPVTIAETEISKQGFHIPFEALLSHIERSPTDDDVLKSLLYHVTCGHFHNVEQFLDIFPKYKTNELITTRDEQSRKWSTIFDELDDTVQREIGDSYLRGVIQESQENDLNREIGHIVTSHRQGATDAHLAVGDLNAIREKLHGQEEDHKKELRARLGEAAKTMPDSAIAGIKPLIDAGECIQAHDALAQAYDVQAGRTNSFMPPTPLGADISDAEAFFTQLQEGTIPPAQRQATKDIVHTWENLTKTRSDRGKLGDVVVLLRWLGFSLEQNVSPAEMHREGPPAFWIVSQYEMTINCPIPQWGSLAGKRHTIIMGSPPQYDYLLPLLKTLFTEKSKRLSRNQPITVLWFGTLSYTQRLQLIQQCRNHSYLPIVIDENLFRWLYSIPTSEMRTKALFSASLAGAPCNPYTPNAAGAVPREMFFGREKDIEALWDSFGPCIVYGGRQLGKSALLFQLKNRHHNPEIGQYVLLHSMRQTDSSLVEAALHEMKREKILSDRTTRNTFFDKVKEFLAQSPNRRILLLFDECDAILEQDARSHRDAKEFPELTIFRDLMVQTERRFKIVLTGLHSVQRFSRIPNSPLPHFGSPLCVGPLQPDAAAALVRTPMECLGLKFAPPTLVSKILTYANYHPSLIQLFCEELVKSIGTKTHIISKIPVPISSDVISQVYKKADLRTKIRQRFDWTLALDKRYRAIGYTLALWELTESQNKPGAGMCVSALLDELRITWPAAFANMERVGVEALLEEMVGLGILSPVGSMFRLRTPNIIHLLGGDENILSELEQFHSQAYTPGGRPEDVRTLLHSRQPDALVLAQHNAIKFWQGSLLLIVGTQASGLERVPDTLLHIAENSNEDTYRKGTLVARVNGTNPREILHAIAAKNKEHREGEIIFWMDAREIPDPLAALLAAQEWRSGLRTDKKITKFVCLMDAKNFLELQLQYDAGTLINSTSTQILFLHRWTQASLEDWYHQSNRVPSSSIGNILQRTGGWDTCIMAHLEGKEPPDLGLPGYSFPDTPEVNAIIRTLVDFGDNLSDDDLRTTIQNDVHYDILMDTLTSLGILMRSQENLLSLEPRLAASLRGAHSA